MSERMLETVQNLEWSLRERFPQIQVFYLFGSQAQGTGTEKSDVDCAAFVEPEALEADPLYELRVADFLDARLHRRIDFVVMNKANPILQHEVLRTGRRIFETDSETRAISELVAFKRYLDKKHLEWERRNWEKADG